MSSVACQLISHTCRRARSTGLLDLAPWLAPPIVTFIVVVDWPDWVRMWTVSLTVFLTCKWLTWRRAIAQGATPPVGRSLAYLLAWPGMDAPAFLSRRSPPRLPTFRAWAEAWLKTSLGVALVFVVATTVVLDAPTLAAWLALVGLVLLLHCGTFHLLALWWQRAGIVAEPIMNRPLYAVSLAEFWGRRWNRAFRQLADLYVFRPLVPRVGAAASLVAVLLVSGLVHDFVMTVSAGGGYGGPTLYFLIQAAALLFVRSGFGRRLRLAGGPAARAFAAVVLVAPLPLLCPPEFLNRIVVPMLHAIRTTVT